MTNATWAGRSAKPPTPHDDKERAAWVPVVGVIAALGLVGAGGYVLGSSDGNAAAETAVAPTTTSVEVEVETTLAAENEPAEAEGATAETTEAPAESSADADASTDSTEPAAEDTSDTETETTTVPADDGTADTENHANQVVLEEGEVRGAVLRGGVLYLGGAVPSQEVADQIIERAEAVVGAGNVVSEYEIDPAAEMGQGAPLHIDDVVLFAYGENTYDPQFEPLLDLGLLLLSQNPTVTVTIITHTDASGSSSYNDRLSYQRGQSVAQYWVDRGIPVEQIVIDARGERDPRADNNDDAGAQLNRRAEFYIEGLLE